MWKLTKQYWKDVWALLWSKTSIDEKAIATVKEIKKRYKLTAGELADVAKAIKVIINIPMSIGVIFSAFILFIYCLRLLNVVSSIKLSSVKLIHHTVAS